MKLLFVGLVLSVLVGCNTLPPVSTLESEKVDIICYTSDNITFEAGVYLEGVVFAREGYTLVPVTAAVDTKKGIVELYNHKGESFYQLTLWKQ